MAFERSSDALETPEAGAPKVKPCEGLADPFEEASNNHDSIVSNPATMGRHQPIFKLWPARGCGTFFTQRTKTRTPITEQSLKPVVGCFESSSNPLRRFMSPLNEVGSICGLVAWPGTFSFATTMVVDDAAELMTDALDLCSFESDRPTVSWKRNGANALVIHVAVTRRILQKCC